MGLHITPACGDTIQGHTMSHTSWKSTFKLNLHLTFDLTISIGNLQTSKTNSIYIHIHGTSSPAACTIMLRCSSSWRFTNKCYECFIYWSTKTNFSGWQNHKHAQDSKLWSLSAIKKDLYVTMYNVMYNHTSDPEISISYIQAYKYFYLSTVPVYLVEVVVFFVLHYI